MDFLVGFFLLTLVLSSQYDFLAIGVEIFEHRRKRVGKIIASVNELHDFPTQHSDVVKFRPFGP